MLTENLELYETNSTLCRPLVFQYLLCPSTTALGQHPPQSPISTLQLVDWTCLQWAICLGTWWNWCPHLPEAINSKYDCLRSCTTILLPAEYNKVELCWRWRGGGKPAHGPQRVMGNYFRQIYTGSHAEWWTTVFDPRRQEKQQRFSLPPWVNSNWRMGLKDGGGRQRKGSHLREAKVRWLIGRAAQGQPLLLGWWVKRVQHWEHHLMHGWPSCPLIWQKDDVVTQSGTKRKIDEK